MFKFQIMQKQKSIFIFPYYIGEAWGVKSFFDSPSPLERGQGGEVKLRQYYLLLFLLTTLPLLSQKKEFNDSDLLQNHLPANFYTPLPTVIRWIDDEHVVLKINSSSKKSFVLNTRSGRQTPVTANDTSSASGKTIISKENDLYYLNNGSEKRLTNDKDEEKNPTFSPDSTYIAYTKNNNLYTCNLISGKETRLTTDGSDTILNGYASWVYYEEIFGRPTKYRAFWWSPDSKSLAFMRFDDSGVPAFPIYVSEGQHGFFEQTRYPKAGDKNPRVKTGIVNRDGGSIVWADFNEKDDQYFGWPVWNLANNTLWVQWMNRAQNNLKIYEVNTTNGSKKEIYDEKQATWIELEDNAGERITFLENGKGFILPANKTGWNHLYLYNINGTLKNTITTGNFTVLDIKYVDEKNSIIYFTARSRENSARTAFYRVNFNGTGLKRLTFGEYNHASISLSPNGRYFITTYNNTSTPPKMALVDNNGKVIREIGDSKGAAMNDYNIAKTELIRIKSSDGLFDLPAVVTWPLNMDSGKTYPMLISIYGGPNAGNVWDSWVWNANRQFYAKEGLIQVAFDHRASGHFGKQGANYVYHNLGYWEMEDYKTMAKWFVSDGHADPARICITGFSYGGYLTAYALTYGSDVFTYGMAGGSVVDWSLYDTHYTERYMGTPPANLKGYKASSVLSYIDRYKGMLQIVHGTSDDNVHMQNSLQLISALQDQKKEFEFMLYPGGRHGWKIMPSKWDHYDNLKTGFIYKYLLKKPVPKGVLK